MIYICAGIHRSGSTWLYNAVRVLLKKAGAPDLAAGWVGDREELLTHRNVVIKLHKFDAELAARADVVLTSHRDLRDVVLSMDRLFHTGFSTTPIHLTIRSYMRWAQVSAYDLHYERLLTGKLGELKKIAAVLKLPPETLDQLPYETILSEIDSEKFNKNRATVRADDKVNLLHERHITDGRHGSWVNVVPDEIVAAIEKEFHGWMVTKGYLGPAPKVNR